jgi:serine protease DegS
MFMSNKPPVPFLVKYIASGLLVAFAIIWLWPSTNDTLKVNISSPTTPLTQHAGPVSYALAVERAAPAVVNIYSEKVIQKTASPLIQDPALRRFFGQNLPDSKQEKQTSLGSGVIVSTEGYLLTNYHVVKDASQINITLTDGRSTRASIVGTDQETDLAVLKINLNMLPAIQLSLFRPVSVGDVVLAIGNPFGVGQTVTQGIISATGRNHLGINTFENFIQTDAAINPGNSGGALINPLGELIGINTAIFSKSGGSQGIGFAIPIDLAFDVFQQIVQQGRAVRGWLGVRAITITSRMAEILKSPGVQGALIEGVLKGGPADQAGLLPGDIITQIDGNITLSTHDILDKVSKAKPGQQIELNGIRNGEDFSVVAVAVERPTPANQ